MRSPACLWQVVNPDPDSPDIHRDRDYREDGLLLFLVVPKTPLVSSLGLGSVRTKIIFLEFQKFGTFIKNIYILEIRYVYPEK
jgi:hypothetical protein